MKKSTSSSISSSWRIRCINYCFSSKLQIIIATKLAKLTFFTGHCV